MLRRSELEWFYQGGADHLFPDAWEHYLEPIPEVERGDLMSAYYRRLTSDDEGLRRKAARAWSIWEGSTSYLHQNLDHIARTGEDEFAEAFARIECHYFVNRGFFDGDGVLLDGVDLGSLGDRAMREQRRKIQLVFQDPLSSLNPRKTIRQIMEALPIGRAVRIITPVGFYQILDGQAQALDVQRAGS